MDKTTTRKSKTSATKQADWKGAQPRRWKSSTPKGQGVSVGFKMVSVKMRPSEAAEFEARCQEIGVTKNNALRSMARHVSGFLEVDKKALAELKLISRQLRGIGTNINQIAKAGNRTGSPEFRAFMDDRRALGPQLIELQKHLQTVLDLGGRRQDGLAKLKDVVGDQ